MQLRAHRLEGKEGIAMPQEALRTVSYKTGHTGRRALLCILMGVAILAVSLRVEKQLGLPLPFSFTLPTKSETGKKNGTDRRSKELSLSGHTLYALQLGAFTQEDAARQLAQEFSSRGAAGYVLCDGGAYRVLAAAYPTRAEAQAVQTRLNGQNISTYIHPCVQEAISLRAGGEERQVDAVEETLRYLDGLGGKLHILSASLDSRERSAPEARDALLSEGETCAGLRRNLLAAFDGTLPDSLAPLERLLAQAADSAEAARNENSAARVGAALKKCQLTVFFGLDAFTRALRD